MNIEVDQPVVIWCKNCMKLRLEGFTSTVADILSFKHNLV